LVTSNNFISIDGRHPYPDQMEPRPGGAGQDVNPVAVEDGDSESPSHFSRLVTAKEGGSAHLDGGGPHYHHKNGRENKQEEGKQDLYRQFGGPFFSRLGPLDPEKGSMGAKSLHDTGAHFIRLDHQSHQSFNILDPGTLPQIPERHLAVEPGS
jgi:hypothetical protein